MSRDPGTGRWGVDMKATPTDGGPLKSVEEVAAIGFKAVHGGRVSGVVRVGPDVLAAMEEMAQVAPAHNPPYVRVMRLLGERMPSVPLVAAFETGFHATIPDRNSLYAVPQEWVEKHLVRRWGFHGASHRFVGGLGLGVLEVRRLPGQVAPATSGVHACAYAAGLCLPGGAVVIWSVSVSLILFRVYYESCLSHVSQPL